MQSSFDAIAPRDIVAAYDDSLRNELSKGDLLAMLCEKLGDKTVEVMPMAQGCWPCCGKAPGKTETGTRPFSDLGACDRGDLSDYYNEKANLTSYRLTEIKPHLKG
jgi:hypothetical protein